MVSPTRCLVPWIQRIKTRHKLSWFTSKPAMDMSLIRFGAMLLRRPFDPYQVVGGDGAGSSTDRAPTVIGDAERDAFGDMVLPDSWIVPSGDDLAVRPAAGPAGRHVALVVDDGSPFRAGRRDAAIVADDGIPPRPGAEVAASPMPAAGHGVASAPMPANPPLRTRRPKAKAKPKMKPSTGDWKALHLVKGLGGPLYVKTPYAPSAPFLDMMQSFQAELNSAMREFRRRQSCGQQLSYVAVLKEHFRGRYFKISSKPPGARLPRSLKQTYEYDGQLLVRVR